MKKTIVGSLLAGALLALTAFSAQAQDKVYKVGMDQTDYPPFATKDTSGKWTGWEVDMAMAVCEAAKIKCELFPTAWDGIIPALQEGKIDFIFASMTINDDRKQQVNFTHFYYDSVTIIVGQKSDTTKIDFDNPDSVKGKVFGAQNATIHSKFLQSRFSKTAEIKTYDGLDTALADLAAGRVDYVQEGRSTIAPFLATDAGKDFEEKAEVPKGDPIMGEGVGAAVRKDDKDTLDKLNAAIKQVATDGTYDKITAKYPELNGMLVKPTY
ncbi:transporter substrate-binding domain-containing protein [Dongia sedimenti]|uniref:Transporter substrate-binding domain-containing protein n=1 Tax=Dongia sedimenti TaxID=3064282 RepID=A0ABU0YHP8_9PROT|nr:transporter substrate-binding domain-containing protein [Rhodospirillaceae bacterium R-7]